MESSKRLVWTILSDTLVPWSPWVTRYTGGLSQLPVVEMSWEKKSKKKRRVHNEMNLDSTVGKTKN